MLELTKVSVVADEKAHICMPCYYCWPKLCWPAERPCRPDLES